jgi:integrase
MLRSRRGTGASASWQSEILRGEQMANLGVKGGIYVARFRYQGKEYKKSLKTTSLADAKAAMHAIEQTIHRLTTGMIQVAAGVDPGDFILSGGTARLPAAKKKAAPPVAALIDDYLAHQSHIASSYLATQTTHLRNFRKQLGARVDLPCDRIVRRDLEQYLQARFKVRTAETVGKERFTLVKLFEWAVAHEYLEASPAVALTTIKGDADKKAFRTVAEIDAILERGGLSETEAAELWDCLYLTPPEIGDLLALVRTRASRDYAPLLHAIPAYTGMRRGEVLRLRWSDVEMDQDSIIARSRKQSRQKSETARRIDLHPELKALLLDWRGTRPRGQFVICEREADGPITEKTATRYFCQPLRSTPWCLSSKKRWFKVGFHTYRHSFASNLAARGVDQRIIDEWMGHQTESMRKRYRHLFPKERRSAMNSFSFTN